MPTAKKKTSVATQAAIRWSLSRASREFGQHYELMERRRRAQAIEPGEDGFYSSQQVAAMLFGDKDAEMIGKLAAERKSTELSNARQMGQLIPTEIVAQLVERVLIAVKQRLLSSGMTQDEKTEILTQLVSLEALDWVAQSKKAAKVKL